MLTGAAYGSLRTPSPAHLSPTSPRGTNLQYFERIRVIRHHNQSPSHPNIPTSSHRSAHQGPGRAHPAAKEGQAHDVALFNGVIHSLEQKMPLWRFPTRLGPVTPCVACEVPGALADRGTQSWHPHAWVRPQWALWRASWLDLPCSKSSSRFGIYIVE